MSPLLTSIAVYMLPQLATGIMSIVCVAFFGEQPPLPVLLSSLLPQVTRVTSRRYGLRSPAMASWSRVQPVSAYPGYRQRGKLLCAQKLPQPHVYRELYHTPPLISDACRNALNASNVVFMLWLSHHAL